MSLFRPEPSLTGLPDEILVQILSYLPLKSDLFNISQISPRLKKVATDKRIIRKRLDVNEDPNFNEEALAFFTDSTIGDQIQEVNIEGVIWINPWQLVKKLPSLTKIFFTVSRRCPKELIQMGKEDRIIHLKKLDHISLKIIGGESDDVPQFVTTRFLTQVLSHCENLRSLEIFSDSISWLSSSSDGVKLSKLTHLVFHMESNIWKLDAGSKKVMQSFIRRMLRKNKQNLEGWCQFPGTGKVKWWQEMQIETILQPPIPHYPPLQFGWW